MTTKNAISTTEEIAKRLQTRRETYVKVLEQLPCAKAKVPDFPYANMGQAVRDGFKKMTEGETLGENVAFALLVKGYKTQLWRKAAEKNRETRDAAAEGTVPAPLAKRVAKKIEVVAAEIKEAAASDQASV